MPDNQHVRVCLCTRGVYVGVRAHMDHVGEAVWGVVWVLMGGMRGCQWCVYECARTCEKCMLRVVKVHTVELPQIRQSVGGIGCTTENPPLALCVDPRCVRAARGDRCGSEFREGSRRVLVSGSDLQDPRLGGGVE
jgi:hypothetical protein